MADDRSERIPGESRGNLRRKYSDEKEANKARSNRRFARYYTYPQDKEILAFHRYCKLNGLNLSQYVKVLIEYFFLTGEFLYLGIINVKELLGKDLEENELKRTNISIYFSETDIILFNDICLRLLTKESDLLRMLLTEAVRAEEDTWLPTSIITLKEAEKSLLEAKMSGFSEKSGAKLLEEIEILKKENEKLRAEVERQKNIRKAGLGRLDFSDVFEPRERKEEEYIPPRRENVEKSVYVEPPKPKKQLSYEDDLLLTLAPGLNIPFDEN